MVATCLEPYVDGGSFGQPLELPPQEPLWPIREDQKPEAQRNFVVKGLDLRKVTMYYINYISI